MRTRSFLRSGQAIALFGLTATLSTAASAMPWGVRLSHPGDPTTEIGIGYNSDAANDVEIHFGTNEQALNQTVTVDGADVVTQAAALGFSFSATLSGLAPNTTYFYKVGRTGALYPQGAPYRFTTLPADDCSAFRAVFIGDNRSNINGVGASAIYPGILEAALNAGPNVFINTGDMVKNGEVAEEWRDFLEKSESAFSLVPTLPTLGNHDEDELTGDAAIYNQLFRLPRNDQTGTEDYYSIDLGPIHLVSVNSQFTNASDLPQQLEWLDADLAANTKPWTIVFFHKAIYTRGSHYTGEEDNGALNAAFVPVFDRHHVDIVMNGHSHDYERYAPSLGVDTTFGGTGRTFPAGNGETIANAAEVPNGEVGTTYIVTGGGGAATLGTIEEFLTQCLDPKCTFCTGLNIGGCEQDVLDTDREGTVVFSSDHHYVALDVDGDVLTAEVISTDDPGVVLDAWTMRKVIPNLSCNGAPDAGPAPVDAGVDDAGTPAGVDGGDDTAGEDAGEGPTPEPSVVPSPTTPAPENAPSVPSPTPPAPEPTPAPATGDDCSCGATSRSSPNGAALVALIALLGLVRRRTRRR